MNVDQPLPVPAAASIRIAAARPLPGSGPSGAWRWCGLVLTALTLVAGSGCVQRRLTIRSNPPGAVVYVDNEEIGTTPCATDYIYYGTREIKLVKDGYETLSILQPLRTPWYEYFPLEFVSENVVPWEIRDERAVTYNLVPQVIVPTQELLNRADELRRGSRMEGFVPSSAPLPGQVPPIPTLPPPAPPLSNAL